MEPNHLLGEQLAYYRARAPEYDRWFHRQGRYDRGEAANQAWFRELDEVAHVLASMPLAGADVLELAAGTGLWTERLVDQGAKVTALDASPEMVEQNRRRLGARSGDVTFLHHDLFEWQPDRRWDAVVFCFWISHVPAARLDDFLATVADALRPDGSVFFLDARREPASTAADHALPGPGEEVMVRRLDDGRAYRIVKNFWPAASLSARFAVAGLDVEITETSTYFQYGIGRRRG